ncbi:MAG: aminotransferase class III-fold pyridoxal phosphate-dependent enzyme, partial [Deltaproteobacteria bacterium]
MVHPFDLDGEILWHPATHFADADVLPPRPIVRAAGAYLFDVDGRAILDAISSWWTALHGHCHPRIVRAVQDQVAVLDHVMFAGFTHGPAVDLARRLLDLAGPGFGRVFYADCGSAAIEVAMKMAFQYHLQSGNPRRSRFAALERGYHGETLGALSACGETTFREPFDPLCRPALYLPVPSHESHRHEDLATDLGADDAATRRAIDLLHEHRDELAALVVEPAVQCAGRMNMPGSGFFRRITEVARDLGILVIADE